MPGIFPDRFFITGTDTDIGKTVIAAMLTQGLGARYFKPIQSGTEQATDTDTVRQLTALPREYFSASAYTLKAPLSPHLAAAQEKTRIDLTAITLPADSPAHGGPGVRLIVEGAGGLMVPLNNEDLMIDLIQKLGLPTLVVAPNRMGTINQTLLSLAALRARSIPVIGVILNRGINPDHARAITHFSQTPVIGQIPELPELSPSILLEWFNRLFTS
jgi:dethiobiotin synthase